MSDHFYVNLGHDGQLRVRELTPEDKRWRIYLQNKLRLAELEQRRLHSPLNEPKFKAEPEVR